MRKLLLGLSAIALLGACSDKGADADGDGKITQDEMAAEMRSEGAIDMEPGEWEVKTSFTELTAPGLPPQAQEMAKAQMLKGTTIKTCLTKEQVADPGAEFLGGNNDACSFKRFDRSGSGMSAEMSCKLPGGMTMDSTMDGTFAKASYNMKLDSKMTGRPMGEVVMKGTIEGTRIGDCPAG